MGNRKIKKWTDHTPEQIAEMSPSAIQKVDPERYACIVRMLREGAGVRMIAKSVGASHETIYKIINRDESLNKGLDVLTAKLNKCGNQVLDRMNEIMEADEAREKVGFRDLTIAAGVVTDKLDRIASNHIPNNLSVTQINVNAAPDLNKLIADLPSAKPEDAQNPCPTRAEAVDAEEVL